MARERTGFVSQKRNKKTAEVEFFARVQYTDENTGKRRELMRKAKDEGDAQKIIKRLIRQLEKGGAREVDGDRMKFRQLAAEYKKRKLIPAEYHGERKVAGLRSLKPAQVNLESLIEYFGGKRISTIRHDDVEQYKLTRLNEPTRRDVARHERELKTNSKADLRATRTIASVNRELELLRAVMRFAQRQGWLSRSPFETGAPVISKADEVRRERVLTHDEERRLLDACGERMKVYNCRRGKKIVQITVQDKGERRAHLRPLIIAALDTAMRHGELLKLRWSDVNLDAREILIRAMNTKTARGRVVAMTPGLHAELKTLKATAPPDPEGLVFGVTDSVKRSFAAACKVAGIDGFRFHDCRHTAITRMVQAGLPPMEVMKISGHTQMTTFARYVNPNSHSVRRAADALAAFNAEVGAQDTSEMVN